MKKFYIIFMLTGFLVLFSVLGSVSAANLTVNPGNSIQTAVNNASNGDTIIVNDNNGSDYTYNENIIINKNITLKSSFNTVTIHSSNPSQSVLIVNNGGSGSIIEGFTINGSNNSVGILLENVNECTIKNNNINGNYQGIYLSQSSYNTITNNAITNNTYGIFIPAQYSYDNNIIANYIIANDYGIFSTFHSFNIQFNRIIGNNCSGLWFEGEEGEFFDISNNWWGSNSRLCDWNWYDPNISYDIFFNSGLDPLYNEIYFTPWLILNVNSSSMNTNNNSIVTADLTHNSNGEDISPLGHLPDGIPVNFTTNLGTITSTAYTSNGKANVSFSRGTASSGTATVTAALDGQCVQTNITIINADSTAPTVTASLASGTYNRTQSVTLTATDNIDPNPAIYYTINSSTPTILSTMYTGPIVIINPGTTTLKFIAVDSAGNQATVQTQNYTLNLVSDINTGKTYSKIQDAINDPSTLNGHTIEILSGSYTENIIVNKSITLKPVIGSRVTIKAQNYSNPTIIINSGGINSTINGFTITGGIYGVHLNSANDCTILENAIRGNGCSGLWLLNSNNNKILQNTIINNGMGVILQNSMNNTISGNNNSVNIEGGGFNLYNSTNNIISNNNVDDAIRLGNYSLNNAIFENNLSGIYISDYSANSIVFENNIDDIDISNSDNTQIYGNNITGYWARIYIYNSSANIHYNRITGNIENVGNGTVNATNNWWGTNIPLVSSNGTANIMIMGGTVLYDPWLVLNVTPTPASTNGNSTVTADLTHNSDNNDTSPQGHIPNSIPVNFSTNLGTITSQASTRNGKANVSFSRGITSSGTATVTAALDGQIVRTDITIANADSTAPTVTASLASGIYNRTQSVILTANDNVDPNPAIYYTINGSAPTILSTRYTGRIIINNPGTTILMFIAVDSEGNHATVQTKNYTLNLVSNINTGMTYSRIQDAINDPLTLNGHVIEVEMATYVENIVLNKKLKILPSNAPEGVIVPIIAVDPLRPVLTITSAGSGSYIFSLEFRGATNSTGIYLNSVSNCTIDFNSINLNREGILLQNSSGNLIEGNDIEHNQDGLSLYNSCNNSIVSNDVINNTWGIFIPAECMENISSISLNNTISRNRIKNNTYGIYLIGDMSAIFSLGGMHTNDSNIIGNSITENIYGVYSNSSPFNMHFNMLNNNRISNLWLEVDEGISFNAKDNWWGSNHILMDYSDDGHLPTIPMDIFCQGALETWYWAEAIGDVTPWLVLNVTANPVITNSSSTITVDLTHNSDGDDTSSQGYVPNQVPVNFSTNMGSITSPYYLCETRNGKVNVNYNRGTTTSGTATVSVNLDEQTVQTNLTIDAIAPTVTANIASGVYNTTKTVTLNTSDNFDPHPIIYYTTDGSNPTNQSTIYTNPITIINTTILKFTAIDNAGNQAAIQTRYYTSSLLITNNNTGNKYLTIQSAIDDPLTVDGDVIFVGNGTFYENIVVNKKLIITSRDDNVTIYNARLNIPVFTITSEGSGSVIQGFTLVFLYDGAADYADLDPYTIFLDHACNCTIYGNTISKNGSVGGGICLTASPNNVIYGNNVTNYCYGDGISIFNDSDNNIIIENNISGNWNGILILFSDGNVITQNNINTNNIGLSIDSSNDNDIYANSISNNVKYGFYTYCSSVTINFNRIIGNNWYGLYNEWNGAVNATNNWWGTNNPQNSSTHGSAIYAPGGTVLYNPWLELNLTGSVIHVTHNSNSTSEITADLTHNNRGEDTSTSGTIPDGLPVNFTTTLGTITPTATTKRGKATVILTSSPYSGATTVTASTYNQTVFKSFRKSFSTIQAAISNSLTIDGDVIVVANGTYTENIYVNKNLTLISEGNVTVQASNPSDADIYISKWGSGTVIAYFNLINATNNCGIYLNSATNCTIYSNNITGNFNGIILYNSTGNIILNNTILNNENVGIGLDYSNNNTITKNNVSNNWVGTSSLDSYNNIISRNKLYRNGLYGVYMDASNDPVLENSITYNLCGIGLYRSASNQIHFNQIFGNTYGLFANGTSVMVNATNNWWGHENNTPRVAYTDTPADIIIYNGNVVYDPWLILTVYPTSYKVANGKIYEATITADLTYNSDGTDTSIQGRVPDGIPVYFYSQYGTNTFQQLQYTLNGKASTNLVRDPNYHDVIFIMGAVDGDYNFTGVDWIAKAVVNVVGSAVNLSNTNQKLNLTYEIPLNDPTTWVSVLWKETSLYHGEVDLIVNGVVVKSCNVVNAAYLAYHNSYSEEVFKQIKFVNSLFLNPVESTTFVPNQYLQPLIDYYHLENMTFDQLEDSILLLVKIKNNFTDNEIAFIKNHRLEFIDLVGFIMAYPGDAIQTISFVDPDNNQTVSINFPGNPILRMSPMIYYDGYMEDTNGTRYDVGYEGVRSFAIATTKVTNSEVQYWLDKQSLYAPGAMKAAYGTFLTSLLVIKCHDMVADQAATAYNVTWSRTTPVVVSCCDDAASSYITGEMNHRMGMDVNGTASNVWAFRFACSSAFSPIEQEIGNPNGTIGSVTMGIGERIIKGETPELFYSNGQIVLKIKDKDDLILMVDPITGIVRDVSTTICGAYCYHNQITNRRIDLAQNLTSSDPNVQPEWLNSTAQISMASSAAVLVGLEVTGESPLFLAGIEIGSTVPVVGVMIGGGLVLAAVLNYICDQYGWLPPEQSREILGNAFLPFALINTFLYDESTPTTKQLEEAYWKAGYLLMAIDNSDYGELYRAITSGSLQDSKYYLNNGIKREKAVKDFLSAGGPKGDKAKFLKNLYDKSKKRCDDGWNELKEGDVANGLVDITIGLWGFDLWGSILALEVIPKEALSQIKQEILRILS